MRQPIADGPASEPARRIEEAFVHVIAKRMRLRRRRRNRVVAVIGVSRPSAMAPKAPPIVLEKECERTVGRRAGDGEQSNADTEAL